MIAIMTILPRDATAGAGGVGLLGVVVWPCTAFSFLFFQALWYLQRDAAIERLMANVTHLHIQRESLTIGNHPSNI
jgi:hypothetical protein